MSAGRPYRSNAEAGEAGSKAFWAKFLTPPASGSVTASADPRAQYEALFCWSRGCAIILAREFERIIAIPDVCLIIAEYATPSLVDPLPIRTDGMYVCDFAPNVSVDFQGSEPVLSRANAKKTNTAPAMRIIRFDERSPQPPNPAAAAGIAVVDHTRTYHTAIIPALPTASAGLTASVARVNAWLGVAGSKPQRMLVAQPPPALKFAFRRAGDGTAVATVPSMIQAVAHKVGIALPSQSSAALNVRIDSPRDTILYRATYQLVLANSVSSGGDASGHATALYCNQTVAAVSLDGMWLHTFVIQHVVPGNAVHVSTGRCYRFVPLSGAVAGTAESPSRAQPQRSSSNATAHTPTRGRGRGSGRPGSKK